MDITKLPGWVLNLIRFQNNLRIAEYSLDTNEVTIQIVNTPNFLKTSVEDLFNNGQFQLFSMTDIILLSYILGHNINHVNEFKLHGINFSSDNYVIWNIKNNTYTEDTATNIFNNKDILFGLSKSEISEVSFKAGIEYEHKNIVAEKILKNDKSLKIIKSMYYNGKMVFTVKSKKEEQTLEIEEMMNILEQLSPRDSFILGQTTNDLNKRISSID